eukprot:355203-Chlamydomonas_euryale.AAC.3
MPEVMREKGMAPPPKHALHLGGQKEMQDRRREELERWVWRLLSRPAVASSQPLRAFLELDKAKLRFQQQRCARCCVPSASLHARTAGQWARATACRRCCEGSSML